MRTRRDNWNPAEDKTVYLPEVPRRAAGGISEARGFEISVNLAGFYQGKGRSPLVR